MSKWSGRPAEEHQDDADWIAAATILRLGDAKAARERAERVLRSATEIQGCLSTMSPGDERLLFDSAFQREIDYWPVDPECLDDCLKALVVASKVLMEIADEDLARLPHAKNQNRMNIEIAIEVAKIYVRVTGKEPPAGGENGPFQRLLRDIYDALGRGTVDLRRPLRKVREYRKNRHS